MSKQLDNLLQRDDYPVDEERGVDVVCLDLISLFSLQPMRYNLGRLATKCIKNRLTYWVESLEVNDIKSVLWTDVSRVP